MHKTNVWLGWCCCMVLGIMHLIAGNPQSATTFAAAAIVIATVCFSRRKE